MKVFGVIALVCCSLTAMAETIVLSDARLLLPSSAEPVAGALVVENGTIVYVGSDASKIPEGPGVETMALGGKLVTPGFIDSASTHGIEEVGLSTRTEDQVYKGNEMGAAFNPALAFNRGSSILPAIANEGTTHAMLRPMPGVDAVAGLTAMVHFGSMHPSVYEGSEAMLVYLGEQGRELTGESRAAALQRLVRALAEASLYGANKKAYKSRRLQTLEFPLADLEALLPVAQGRRKLALYIDRATEIETVLSTLDSTKLDIVILGAREAWKVSELLKQHDVPVVLNPMDNLPLSFDRLGARLDHPALLHRAGIRFAFMTENNFTNTKRLSQGAGVAVSYGLPWHQAIMAMTADAAAIWGVDDAGALKAGAEATLVIWNHQDPLELSAYAERVMIRGQWMKREDRQLLLRDRYSDLQAGTPY